MGFSERELVNINSASLQANGWILIHPLFGMKRCWLSVFVLPASKIWTQISSIPTADTLNQARTNAAANPTIIQDLSQNASAVRLAEVPGY